MTCLDTLAREHVEGFTRSDPAAIATVKAASRPADASGVKPARPEKISRDAATKQREPLDGFVRKARLTDDDDTGLSGSGRASGTGSAGCAGSIPARASINPECRQPATCDRATATLACKPCRDAWIEIQPEERMRRRAAARPA